jgi:hypothetical protein
MKYTEVNKIYKTDNYGMFKRLEGNRAVSNIRKKRLNDSFDKVGQIPSPIVVNEKMEIIDGQGRFEVSKERNLPIYFTMIKGIGDRECICMNTGTMNWSMRDYVDFYAEKGLEDYKVLQELDDKYTNVPLSTIIPIARGVNGSRHQKDSIGNIAEGKYKVTIELDVLDSILEFIDTLTPYLKKYTKMQAIVPVLYFCYKCKEIDNDLLKKKILGNSYLMSISKDVLTLCDSIGEIYNRNKRGKIISFRTEYLNQMREADKKTAATRYGWNINENDIFKNAV